MKWFSQKISIREAWFSSLHITRKVILKNKLQAKSLHLGFGVIWALSGTWKDSLFLCTQGNLSERARTGKGKTCSICLCCKLLNVELWVFLQGNYCSPTTIKKEKFWESEEITGEIYINNLNFSPPHPSNCTCQIMALFVFHYIGCDILLRRSN